MTAIGGMTKESQLLHPVSGGFLGFLSVSESKTHVLPPGESSER